MTSEKKQQPHLLSLLNAGDIKAYDFLYKKYYGLIVLYAYKLTNDHAMAEDIVQDIFISIWKNRVQFANDRSIPFYLYRSVRNYYVNHRLHPRSRQIEIDEEALINYCDYDDPNTLFMEEEIYTFMFEAIDQLPKRCREVMLKVLEGKKNMEIAVEMSLSIETVKTQKKRGIDILRKILDKKD